MVPDPVFNWVCEAKVMLRSKLKVCYLHHLDLPDQVAVVGGDRPVVEGDEDEHDGQRPGEVGRAHHPGPAPHTGHGLLVTLVLG